MIGKIFDDIETVGQDAMENPMQVSLNLQR
jgi:hypothetical protein